MNDIKSLYILLQVACFNQFYHQAHPGQHALFDVYDIVILNYHQPFSDKSGGFSSTFSVSICCSPTYDVLSSP